MWVLHKAVQEWAEAEQEYAGGGRKSPEERGVGGKCGRLRWEAKGMRVLHHVGEAPRRGDKPGKNRKGG